MNLTKKEFLQKRLIPLLQDLDMQAKPSWGKMNVQQMIEHFSGDALRTASGKIKIETMITPPEHLEKMQSFLMSEKPFKENTKNVLLSEEPLPVKFGSKEEALLKLQKELDYFFMVFDNNPQMVTRNPFFGDLDYAGNIQLLHKHALHHLRQFGIHVDE